MKKIKYILPLLAMSFAAHANMNTELTEGQKNSVSNAIEALELNAAGNLDGQQVNFVLNFTPEQFPAAPNLGQPTPYCMIYNAGQIQTLKNILQEGQAYKNMMTQNANQAGMMGPDYAYENSGVDFRTSLDIAINANIISFNSKLNGSQLKATFNAC